MHDHTRSSPEPRHILPDCDLSTVPLIKSTFSLLVPAKTEKFALDVAVNFRPILKGLNKYICNEYLLGHVRFLMVPFPGAFTTSIAVRNNQGEKHS